MIGGVIFNSETHAYYHPESKIRLLSVTDVLKIEGFINPYFYDEASRIRGQAVHKAVELIEKGTLNPKSIDPIIQPYVDGYLLFKKETGARALRCEMKVWDPDLNYAGRLDWFGLLNGLSVIDVKTGSMADWTKYQLAGYWGCVNKTALEHYGLPPELRHPQQIKRYGLELRPTGKYNLQPFTNPNDYRLFQSMVSLAWTKINEKIIKWENLHGKRNDSDRPEGSRWNQERELNLN